MRNIFDQYTQPENRLTHALACTLQHDRRLIIPFLRHLGITNTPPIDTLRIVEQQVPGQDVSGESDASSSLPDMCIFDNDGWAVVVETKVQAKIEPDQLKAHRKTARKRGYPDPIIVVIAVGKPVEELVDADVFVKWSEVYAWFSKRLTRGSWAEHFVRYVEVFESKQLAEGYGINGTLTMFNGFHFSADNPYTYREGKRLIRLLGDELQRRKDLHDIGVDPEGKRRGAIKGKGAQRVWDFLPLVVAKDAALFTHFPHFTMSISHDAPTASITIPNGVKGGLRTRLKSMECSGFASRVANVERRLAPVLRKCPRAQPMLYITQRHYKHQGAPAVVDARLEADLRTCCKDSGSAIKYQPQWVEAIYDVLVGKRSNIQLGIDVRFSYTDPPMQSESAIGIFAKTWIAMNPFIHELLEIPVGR
jgi:hypothetical protein